MAFIWENGLITDLSATLGTPKSRAFDIHTDGCVTGWMGSNQFLDAVAFISNAETVMNLGTIPGGITGDGRAITRLLTVAGRGLVP